MIKDFGKFDPSDLVIELQDYVLGQLEKQAELEKLYEKRQKKDPHNP